MTCTFFGHRNADSKTKELLKKHIIILIKERKVDTFYVGNNGNFDYYAQCVLQELKNERSDFKYYVILSYINEKALSGDQAATLFPEELENCVPRFAICKRNNWLINRSSFLLAYSKHTLSNSSKWIAAAQKRGLKVINLADCVP